MESLSDPLVIRQLVVSMIALILSIAVHEFGHAFVADRLGDRLPRTQGRVTLNPLVHADTLGTWILPIGGFVLSAMSGHPGAIGFGWGKPVEVYPPSFSRRFRMKTGHMMVAFAGPAMNLIFGSVVMIVTVVLAKASVIHNPEIAWALANLVMLNYTLAFFNLLPIGPLDGNAVAKGLLPDSAGRQLDAIAPYSLFILAAIMFTPQLSLLFRWPAAQVFNGMDQLLNFWPSVMDSLRSGTQL